MKKISTKQIEKSLIISLNNMTSKKMYPINNLKGDYKMKKNNKLLPFLMPALVAFGIMLFFGMGYYTKNMIAVSDITLDVNPSVTLSTNYYNKVIRVRALNDDGLEILTDINVNNLRPEEAMNVIVDELISQGYLAGDGANILITVQNNDISKAKEIESSLLESVNTKLDDNYIAGTVITQVSTVRTNIPEDIKKLMTDYNISYSKAIFINNIIKKDDTLSVENLATLKISEISKLLNENNIDIKDMVGHNNDDSFYESEVLTQARKAVKEAEQARIEAENNAQGAFEEFQNQLQNQQNIENAQKAYEDAEKARLEAENAAEEAQKAYEEANKNQGSSTQNTETNQNTNGQSENESTTESRNEQEESQVQNGGLSSQIKRP